MYYVYFLQSTKYPRENYVGFTKDLKKRFAKHNKKEVPHTSKHSPWKLKFYIAVETKQTAIDLEKYLKSSSGKAFLNKRLIVNNKT